MLRTAKFMFTEFCYVCAYIRTGFMTHKMYFTEFSLSPIRLNFVPRKFGATVFDRQVLFFCTTVCFNVWKSVMDADGCSFVACSHRIQPPRLARAVGSDPVS